MEQIEKIIVVTGCQRSGTTLTGQILGAHKSCFLIDEPDGLYDWISECIRAGMDKTKSRKVLVKANSKYLPGHRPINTKNKPLRLNSDISCLVLKAPNLTYSFNELKALSKNISIVHPVRDPKAVVASMEKLSHIDMVGNQVKWIKKNSAIHEKFLDEIKVLENLDVPVHQRRALIWKIKTGLYTAFQTSGLDPLVFNYENLIENKVSQIKAIAKHCGLAFDEGLLHHENFYRGMAPGLTERSRPVDKKSKSKWRSRLTGIQAQDIMNIAGDLAASLGYDLHDYDDETVKTPSFSRDVFEAPIILTGRGGSGTRLLSEIAQSAGVFIGNRLNTPQDSLEWVELIYEFAIRKSIASAQNKIFEIKNSGLFLDKTQDVLDHGIWKHGQAWGWKLPETMLIVPELHSIFPQAKLVHLVRHPITSSFRRTHMTSRADNQIGRVVLKASYNAIGRPLSKIKTDPEFLNNAITWNFQVGLVHDYASKNLDAAHYLLVQFEDLCEHPARFSKKITRFMTGDGKAAVKPAMDYNRLPSLDLERSEMEEVWNICQDVAKKIGYRFPDA